MTVWPVASLGSVWTLPPSHRGAERNGLCSVNSLQGIHPMDRPSDMRLSLK